MKISLCLLALLFSGLTLASGVKEFNKALIEDVQKEMAEGDENKLRPHRPVFRGPASVEESIIEKQGRGHIDKGRIEKRNNRQLGMEKW